VNQILISKKDKESLTLYIEKINEALDKYPYYGEDPHFVTTMCRAKNNASALEKNIKLLEINEDK